MAITGLDCALAAETATSARIAAVTGVPLFERIRDSSDGELLTAKLADHETGERCKDSSETDWRWGEIACKLHPFHPVSKTIFPGPSMPRLAPWAIALSLVVLPSQEPAPIRGFSPAASRAEREWEA